MNQIFIGIILILGLGSYYLYTENVTLKENNAKLVYAVEEQKAAIAVMKADFERTSIANGNLQASLNAAESEKSRYLGILSRHNFEKLATVKPGLMENRFNKGTQDLFKGIEDETTRDSTSKSTDSSN
ncbi:hypothetical protein N9I83_00675 [bacterium]|nr:hypothetical protein [bacterium]